MLVRVRRYVKQVKGRIFSVAAYTKTTAKTVSQGPYTPLRGMADMKPKGVRLGGKLLTHTEKRTKAKAALARSRTIQKARAEALGWRVK